MAEPLYMLRMRVDGRRLALFAKERHLDAPGASDPGYTVHAYLGEVFGTLSPAPFTVESSRGDNVNLLAYSSAPKEALRSYAETFADPAVCAALDWELFDAKQMPSTWTVGQRLGFRVRVCPVVRRAKEGGAGEAAGREVDVFLARVEDSGGGPVDRYLTYVEWLRSAINRAGGADLGSARVDAFALRRFVRRSRDHRPGLVPERRATDRGASGRPDVTAVGELVVTDSEAFSGLLRRGLGRHRAFGFGMVLLRPGVDRAC